MSILGGLPCLWENNGKKSKILSALNNDDRYDYDDEYEYEDDEDYAEDVPPVAPTAAASEFHPRKVGGTSTMTQRPTAMKVVVIEPKVFEDSESITHQLRDMRPVLINFENTDPHEAARIVDFVSGATFALDGKFGKGRQRHFLCAYLLMYPLIIIMNLKVEQLSNKNLTGKINNPV